jgi:opacity protein-like surface antigen
MNFRVLAVLAVTVVAVLTPQSTFAQPSGWYIGLGGGYGPMTYTLVTDVSSVGSDTDFALRGIATLGYKHLSGFRAELEPTYSQYRVNDASLVGVGTITTYGGFANLLYDWEILPRVNLVLGGGVGWMRMNADIVEQPPGGLTVARGWKTGFAWQAIAGISAALSHNTEIQLDYRYGGMPSGSFNTDLS